MKKNGKGLGKQTECELILERRNLSHDNAAADSSLLLKTERERRKDYQYLYALDKTGERR